MKQPSADTWDDDEIYRVVKSSPYLPGSDKRLVHVSDETAVKLGVNLESCYSEALAIDLVRAQTSIPVPRVRRITAHMHPDGFGLIVMDLIRNGRRLHAYWHSLSFWMKIKVILTMRYYIRQIRRIKDVHSSTPGPIGSQPLICSGLQFGFDPQGPFPTTTALEEHFRKVLRLAKHRKRFVKSQPEYQPLDEPTFSHLVFTHNDLNMRNILLDDNGHLWIVDWGWAGFFPPGFEYLGMRFAAQKDKEPIGWQIATMFMAEPSFEMERWMIRIGYDYRNV